MEPSGFSVITDSISKSRRDHFDKTIGSKLPSITKSPNGSDNGNETGETGRRDVESDEEILFSGLSYNKLPDLNVGVGQPSKEQAYVKASFNFPHAVVEPASKEWVDRDVETDGRTFVSPKPRAVETAGDASVPVRVLGVPDEEDARESPSPATPDLHLAVPDLPLPHNTLADVTPGKPLDCDYFLDNMDLDDLLLRLEKNQVNNDPLPSTPVPVPMPKPRGEEETKVATKTTGNGNPQKVQEEANHKEKEKGAVIAEMQEETPAETPADDDGDDEEDVIVVSSAPVPAEESSGVEMESFAVASHPIMDLWDEEDVSDESKEEWVFLSQDWEVEDLASLLRTLKSKKCKLLGATSLTMPSDCYVTHVSNARGVVFHVEKPDPALHGTLGGGGSRSTKALLGQLAPATGSFHVFHDSDYIEGVVLRGEGNQGRQRGMSVTRLSALLMDAKGQEAKDQVVGHEHTKREFACVAISPDFESLASALTGLCCAPALSEEKVIENDFPFLSLVAVKTVGAVSTQDREGLVTSGLAGRGRGFGALSPLKRQKVEANRAHRMESGAVMVLLFGPNACSHCLQCLEQGREEILGVVTRARTRYFATKHFYQSTTSQTRILRDHRTVTASASGPGYDYGVTLTREVLDKGLPVDQARCAMDLDLSQTIYLESFLRNLGRQGFALLGVTMSKTGTDQGSEVASEEAKIVLRLEKSDALRDLGYCIHTIKRINALAGAKLAACRDTQALALSRGDNLRQMVRKEKAACVILGPYVTKDHEDDNIFQDLSEVSKFLRKHGFKLEALGSLDGKTKANDEAYKDVCRRLGGEGRSMGGQGQVVAVVFSREMALCKLQLLAAKGALGKLQTKLRWLPKTKEQVMDMAKALKCV